MYERFKKTVLVPQKVAQKKKGCGLLSDTSRLITNKAIVRNCPYSYRTSKDKTLSYETFQVKIKHITDNLGLAFSATSANKTEINLCY